MDAIRVMIVDDHPLLIEGVASVLATQPDMALVCEASDGAEAVSQYQAMRPDVVLMDLQLPKVSGVESIRRIRDLDPAARLLVLTTYRGDVQALAALKAGAHGYLLKSMMRTELLIAIRQVYEGNRWIPPPVASALAAHMTEESLTRRELQVLRQVAEGRSNKVIALELGIAADTVKAHVKNILAKLSARDRTHAVTIAMRRGIMNLLAD
ncbi:MAG: DNA-binding response regulator [Pseudoxanthomonas spadix]|jgi:two-component system NarL family response regulator|nr:MAG: DNA-binding response regulator [Pseudoxanthomonas spadix]